ncbi:regulator of nonsense transcripts 3A-like isoform X2 [Gigantopelta aegis]|uniref:regulator of nonsense transcripts 3A-like isoform X2 n=1 Tax=Gigantopelta aegis TaxID=1735272 RepID=UPI001B8875F7|nr:regulator of nonsense transcripts 3A-like isoform X2 [Gigantopelta aegis]
MTKEKNDVKACKPPERKLTDDRRKIQPPSKVVMRRLPPSLTPEQFLEQVSPLPNYDFFYFVKADMSLGQWAFTRAYINFQQPEDIYIFRDKFDGYIFLDSKGNEYPAIVEFAPFQKVPKKKAKKPDAKKGTIEQDSDYLKFVESLTNPDDEPVSSIDTYLEELEQREKETKGNRVKMSTPLIEFLLKRREEKKQAILKTREDRKRRELERRRFKEEEKRKRREKEKLREKDKFRDKEREKDSDRERGEKKDDPQAVTLLMNPDREREKDRTKDKDLLRSKEDNDKSVAREKLRFSKENREKEKASRNGKAGISEKVRPGKESGDSKLARETPERGGGDHGKGDDRKDDRLKQARDDRGPDRSRSYQDDRPRSTRDREREWSEPDFKERDRDKYRDDRPRSGAYKNTDSRRRYDDRADPPRQGGRYSEERRKYEDRKDQARKEDGRGDKEKLKAKDRPERPIYVPRKALERQKQEAAKQVDGSRGEGEGDKAPSSDSEKGQSSEKTDVTDKGQDEKEPGAEKGHGDNIQE